jgi:hypothetical protein
VRSVQVYTTGGDLMPSTRTVRMPVDQTGRPPAPVLSTGYTAMVLASATTEQRKPSACLCECIVNRVPKRPLHERPCLLPDHPTSPEISQSCRQCVRLIRRFHQLTGSRLRLLNVQTQSSCGHTGFPAASATLFRPFAFALYSASSAARTTAATSPSSSGIHPAAPILAVMRPYSLPA